MNEENPFAAPEVKLLSGTEEQEFDLEPQKRSFGEGRQWVSSAFDIFKSAPALWVGFTVVALGAQLMLSALPFGQLLIALFGMIMAAGGVWVSKKLHEGEEVQFGDFFIGFQLRTKELALAGFKKKEVYVYTQDGKLFVEGQKEDKETESNYLHKGLAQRSFTRSWTLSDDTEVRSVDFEDGLLTVTLGRIVPEHHKRKDYL